MNLGKIRLAILQWRGVNLILKNALCIPLLFNFLEAQTLLSPPNGSSYQNSRGVMLQWEGEYVAYDVYLDSVSSPGTRIASDIAVGNFFTGELQVPHSYFWKVVGIRSDSTRDTSQTWQFNTGNILLQTYKFIPAADSDVYDTELESRFAQPVKPVDMTKAALVVIDYSEFADDDNCDPLIHLARRHNIPVILCPYEGSINHRIQPIPSWELVTLSSLDKYLDEQGITTLFYAGYGSGACVTLSRPNSINTITMRNPGKFDIVFVKDATAGDPLLHYWNVNGIETRWQTSKLNDLSTALGDTIRSIQFSIPDPYDPTLPLKTDFGGNLVPSESALLLVNVWDYHENDGWLTRIKDNTNNRIVPLLKFARSRGMKVLHVSNGRIIDPSCDPIPGEQTFADKLSLWRYLRNNNIRSLMVAGNFDNDLNSIFPLLDGWGLGYEGGDYLGAWTRLDSGRTAFLQDCITAFETPSTLGNELVKKAFLMRQIMEPGTQSLGTVHFLSTLDIMRTNANAAPVFVSTPDSLATENLPYSYQPYASDIDSAAFGDSVSYRLSTKPSWLAFDSLTGLFSGTPNTESLGDTVVAVQAYDKLGAFTEQRFNLHILPPIVRAGVKVFLEGPFEESTHLMKKSLNVGGILASHFAGAAIPSEAVDSVSIEIRDSTLAESSATLRTAPAWLLTDGTVRDFHDTTASFVSFWAVPEGMYYVLVHHRNHLSLMSASPVTLGETPTVFDFTSSSSLIYGGPATTKELVTGIWCMIAGNADTSDQGCLPSDLSVVRDAFLSGSCGYLQADVDMDGEAFPSDYALTKANSLKGFASRIPVTPSPPKHKSGQEKSR